jgi:septin 3/9/12
MLTIQIMAEMQFNQIRLYPFDAEENDEEEIALNDRIRVSSSLIASHLRASADERLQEMLPFAVVGSERSVIIDGKAVRGRKNRWGVINVEDERHCEFVYLRNFLTRYVGSLASPSDLAHALRVEVQDASEMVG